MKGAKTSKQIRRIWAIRLSIVVIALSLLNGVWARENPLGARVADFGQWLSGVAGALAFVWLIISYFQQGEELELQREELAATREQLALQKDEMARLADQAEKQTVSASLTEAHTRQSVFFGAYNLILEQAAAPLLEVVAQYFYEDRRREFVAAGNIGLQQAANELLLVFEGYKRNSGIGVCLTRHDGTRWIIEAPGTHLGVYELASKRVEQGQFRLDSLHRFVSALDPIEALANSTKQSAVFIELQKTSVFLRLRATIRATMLSVVAQA